jgi:UDPglucose--hexose-1-phosphate uridylyltransferase
MAELEQAILNGVDLRSTETLASHAEWAEAFLQKYQDVNADNVTDIIRKEIGLVFAEVLENAGVYKCDEAGREAFVRFIKYVK